MNIIELGAIGELVGGLAVLVTLVYLALQVRQNTKWLRTNAVQASNTRAAEWAHFIAGNAECLHTYRVGLGTPDALEDDDERMRFGLMAQALFRQFEDLFFQHRNGALDAENWAAWEFSIGSALRRPGLRQFWTSRRGLFSSSFAEFIERWIAAHPASTEGAEPVFFPRPAAGDRGAQ